MDDVDISTPQTKYNDKTPRIQHLLWMLQIAKVYPVLIMDSCLSWVHLWSSATRDYSRSAHRTIKEVCFGREGSFPHIWEAPCKRNVNFSSTWRCKLCCVAHGQLPLTAKFMGSTCGPPGTDRTKVGAMLATWTLLSGTRFFTGIFLLTCINFNPTMDNRLFPVCSVGWHYISNPNFNSVISNFITLHCDYLPIMGLMVIHHHHSVRGPMCLTVLVFGLECSDRNRKIPRNIWDHTVEKTSCVKQRQRVLFKISRF